MSNGIRLWNSSGNLTYDIDDRFLKSLGTTKYTAVDNTDLYSRYPYVGNVPGLTYLGGYWWSDLYNIVQQMQGGVNLPTVGANSVPSAVDFSYLCNPALHFIFVYSLDVTSKVQANTDILGFVNNIKYYKNFNFTLDTQETTYQVGITKYYNNKLYIAIGVDPVYVGHNGITQEYSFEIELGRY